jgi:PAS domain-containing protein
LGAPGQPAGEYVLDFIYQPTRDDAGQVDGIFVLVTDVTDRARAEAALRLSNWQLGEERARLAATIEAERRAQTALRRFNDTLEAHVKHRTAQLERALAAQSAIADRLRATFQTQLIYQGFLNKDGKLLDSNGASLAGIQAKLEDVVGRAFWETPWFTGTPGLPELVREAITAAAKGNAVQRRIELDLPNGRRQFDFSLRPVLNRQGEVIGIVPEAVDITGR